MTEDEGREILETFYPPSGWWDIYNDPEYWRGKLKLSKLGEEVMQKLKDELPGGSTPSQYALPAGAKELQDLIEFREMNFAIGNVFKSCYRLGHCSHSDKMRDLRKMKWFIEREIAREERNG